MFIFDCVQDIIRCEEYWIVVDSWAYSAMLSAVKYLQGDFTSFVIKHSKAGHFVVKAFVFLLQELIIMLLFDCFFASLVFKHS